MKKNIILSIIIAILCLNVFAQDETEIVVKSEIKEVTVFLKGAQVLRKKYIELMPGKTVLKFTGLSPYIDSKSIQVKTNEAITVLSVNQQFNYIDTVKVSVNIEELNKKLDALNDRMNINNLNAEILNEELNFLKDNRIIGGKNQELTSLNLKETSGFYSERISTIKTKLFEIDKSNKKLNTEKSIIENQIRQLGSNVKVPVNEIVILVEAKKQVNSNFEISYFVDNAGWNPSYDIRAKSIDEPIELLYKANIHQNTKENWKNVKLRLSSSNPNSGNVAPKLKTYYLNYYTQPPRYNLSTSSNQIKGRVFDSQTNEPLPGATVLINGTSLGIVTDLEGNFSLAIPNNASEYTVSYVGYSTETLPINSQFANIGLNADLQSLEEVVVIGYGTSGGSDYDNSVNWAKSKQEKKVTRQIIPFTPIENQTSFEFDIQTPYTINSDNKSMTVSIESYMLNTEFEYYCIPKVDNDAFLMANVVDWEKYNLLEGEANIFFENTFVGKSVLDVRYISDTLSISLGRDKNVVVKREKIKDLTTKQFFGNNKVETRAWKISVKNNKKQDIKMTLFDQVPVSSLNEIEVEVEKTSGGIIDKETGEVKWKFDLKTLNKKEFELNYKVKYPKYQNLTIE